MPDLSASQGIAGYVENIICKSDVEENIKILYRFRLQRCVSAISLRRGEEARHHGSLH